MRDFTLVQYPKGEQKDEFTNHSVAVSKMVVITICKEFPIDLADMDYF